MDTQLLMLQIPDMVDEDDVALDGWLASLTPDQFGYVLNSLARLRVESRAAVS